MQTLIVNIDNSNSAQKLAVFLKTVSYVKSVDVEDETKFLSGDDWAKPGRPATGNEMEQLCQDMENDKGNFTTEEVKSFIKGWVRKKSR